ncbi:hypothetical protein [Novosphingobium gossypii]|uniref:hypothetical protein n=1 Tax=Novosphingobium gossypii TaxID=1604774 RepID=UPI003D1A2DDC
MKQIASLTAIAFLALAACSSGKQEPAPSASASDDAAVEAIPPEVGTETASESATTATPTAAADVLGLEGLGALKIGQPVPKGGTWAERGAQTGDACRTVSSPDYPGVYAIVENGKVQRITVGGTSKVKLAEGVGIGATEKDVKGWFGGFREEPHKYEAAPAKYLTAPNARPGESALRFEIGQDRRVSLIHVGQMPALGYVEGCA